MGRGSSAIVSVVAARDAGARPSVWRSGPDSSESGAGPVYPAGRIPKGRNPPRRGGTCGYGQEKKKKKNRGMNLDKSNFVSMLFDAEPVGCVRAAAAEAPLAPTVAAVSAPPPARPVLRAARGVSRTGREDGSRPKPKLKPAPPRREEEPSEPAVKRRCGRWLTRDGYRKRGSQFGGLVSIERDQSLDPPPYACFNCLK